MLEVKLCTAKAVINWSADVRLSLLAATTPFHISHTKLSAHRSHTKLSAHCSSNLISSVNVKESLE